MKDDLSVEVRKLDYLKKAARAGKITDDQIKAAYAGNVDVVVPLARKLALSLPGKGAITADHGEMLGEHGEYEHAAPPIYPQLLNVPWHRYVNPPCPVSKIPDHIGRELFDVGSDATRGKLRALGYI